jgi:hypothetical protein
MSNASLIKTLRVYTMKITIIKTLTTIFLITVVGSAFAGYSDCPPSNKIKGAKLISAKKQAYPHPNSWLLLSNTFTDGYRDWNVYFITDFLGVDTEQEVLKLGQTKFDHSLITNNHPYPENSDGMSYCVYAKNENYTIFSASPVQDG